MLCQRHCSVAQDDNVLVRVSAAFLLRTASQKGHPVIAQELKLLPAADGTIISFAAYKHNCPELVTLVVSRQLACLPLDQDYCDIQYGLATLCCGPQAASAAAAA